MSSMRFLHPQNQSDHEAHMPKPGSHHDVHIVKLESLNANSWYQTTLRSAQQMEKDIQAQTKLAVKFKLQLEPA